MISGCIDKHVVVPGAIVARPAQTFRQGSRAEDQRPLAESDKDVDLMLGEMIKRPEDRQGERVDR